MRDELRVKEKFEVSLDGPQVASVVIGALVILGGVFVLGLNVGKQLAGRPAPAAASPADPLAALDAPVAPDSKEPSPRLSYHEALTAPAHKAAPAPHAAPAAAAPAPAPAAAPPEPAAKPAPTPPAAQAAAPAEPEPKAASPAPAAPERPAPPVAERAFAIQVGASQDLGEAGRIADRFKSYRPRIVTAEVPGKGKWYRVRVGAFDTRDEAGRYLTDLARETGASGFVTATR